MKTENNTLGSYKSFFTCCVILVLAVSVANLLRNTKDVLILTKTSVDHLSSAKEFTLAISIIMFVGYIKLTSAMNRLKIYYLFLFLFLAFFVLFLLVLQPNIDHLKLNHQNPAIAYWPYTLFYAFSSLWGGYMVTLMFWQLSNQIFSLNHAKIVYPLFFLVQDLGTFKIAILLKYNPFPGDPFHSIITYVIVAILAISALLYFLSNSKINQETINGTKHTNLGFFKGLKYILNSKIILFLIAISICYSLSVAIVTLITKNQIIRVLKSSQEVGNFMANINLYAVPLLFAAIFLLIYLLKKKSWKIAATFPISIVCIAGICALAAHYTQASPINSSIFIWLTSMALIAVKVSPIFFILTKELVYIPLDEEMKSKGKAIVDIMFARVGPLFFSMYFTIAPNSTIENSLTVFFIAFVVAIIGWYLSIISLNKRLPELSQ